MEANIEGVLIVIAGAALGAILLAFLGPILIAPITKAITGTTA